MPVEQDSCGFGMLIQTKKKACHQTVSLALNALSRLTHRGAVAQDGLSGDGCGVMLDLDAAFFKTLAKEAHISLTSSFAVGMFFLDKHQLKKQQLLIEEVLASEQLHCAGWRKVPTNHDVLGEIASKNKPEIVQAFIEYNHNDIERRLFIVQKLLKLKHHIHVVSLSSKTIVYKGLILPPNLGIFYPDLLDKRFKSLVALFHQRFSTNTLPSWHLAQPFSLLAHNGEINTIRGNLISGKATTRALIEHWYPELKTLPHLLSSNASDSMSLDEFIQPYVHFGMSASELLRLCIPPAWEHANWMSDDEKAYYAYHAPLLSGFEGPAGIVFYDGQEAGCILDRNGFRPARLQMSDDGLLIIGSEAGLVDINPHQLIKQSRIKPGELYLYDVKEQTLIANEITPERFCQRHPYAQWVKQLHQSITPEPISKRSLTPPPNAVNVYFDVSYEEQEKVLKVMAELGVEPTASMGDDTPLAPLSDMPRALFDFFRQQFAQVTNPPIDSLREKLVMSLDVNLGSRTFIGKRNAQFCRQLHLESPLLGTRQLEELFNMAPMLYVSLHYNIGKSWLDSLQAMYEQIISSLKYGHVMCLLQDGEEWIEQPSIHPMFALGYIHQRLLSDGLRDQVSIIVSSGFVRDPHHLAMLVAAGADGVHPWLAYRLIDLHDIAHGRERYRTAMNKGLLKIASKMGVCTINSYRGSLLFQVLGIKSSVIDMCFKSAPIAVERYDWPELQKHHERLFLLSQQSSTTQRQGGLYQFSYGGEYHDYHPSVVTGLINACKENDSSQFLAFSNTINQRSKKMLRDFLTIVPVRACIDINAVEPISHIQKRFETAAMSLGALSPEAHEALAMAMNRMGGRSNSGEGGEAAYRHNSPMRSKIKQVASGRFGVTAEYLMNAEVIQIKMAQGAKPGEGGQLPGNKVNQTIAELRYCLPGVTLISPPPHHDIYSIEDLAQLIFDLKQLNPKAFVSVKLVSEPGIGTIAVGVVKAYADCITISGYDGGTGASPLSSIRYAGCPWELGLMEVHQCLIENGLRHKVTLQVDGGLKTGLDVIKAALLGAETFGFGTAPMVALGCKYLRICHLNNCATGIATQQSVLRQQHYQGTVERVVSYFNHVASEVQEILSNLGFNALHDIIGRYDLLKSIDNNTITLPNINLNAITKTIQKELYQQKHNHPFDKALLGNALHQYVAKELHKATIHGAYAIANHDRSIGASVARLMVNHPEKSVHLHFNGHAGQSFGAFNTKGMHLLLTGAANDYVGKGMSGGTLTLIRPKDTPIDAKEFVIAGNTCLYGATGGRCFMDGLAGERFAVRNSGAHAVVAGVGYHGCEYMTNGIVVVLSSPEPNFAAGMTGGLAFVLDNKGVLEQHINPETVAITPILNLVDATYFDVLFSLLAEFYQETQSSLGFDVLKELKQDGGRHFYIVYPKDLKMPLYQKGQAAS